MTQLFTMTNHHYLPPVTRTTRHLHQHHSTLCACETSSSAYWPRSNIIHHHGPIVNQRFMDLSTIVDNYPRRVYKPVTAINHEASLISVVTRCSKAFTNHEQLTIMTIAHDWAISIMIVGYHPLYSNEPITMMIMVINTINYPTINHHQPWWTNINQVCHNQPASNTISPLTTTKCKALTIWYQPWWTVVKHQQTISNYQWTTISPWLTSLLTTINHQFLAFGLAPSETWQCEGPIMWPQHPTINHQ